MAKIDKIYHDLLNKILTTGYDYEDPNRKGVKRLQIPSYTFEHDMTKGFPAITTKKLAWKSVVGELLWFLRGDTNIKYLLDNNINIWNKDAYNYYLNKCKLDSWKPLSYDNWLGEVKREPNEYESAIKKRHCGGDLGRVYGAQWKKWNAVDHCDISEDGFTSKYIDQISNLIKNLKEQPLATDHIVTAWNPAEIDQMALPPCHNFFQINVWELTNEERYKLYLKRHTNKFVEIPWKKSFDRYGIPKYGFELVWNQRSVDTFLGLPFNIASYGLLAHIIGKLTNMVPMSLKGTLNNVHLYDNSIDAVKKQLSRDVNKYKECTLEGFGGFKMDMREDIDQWLSSKDILDFKLKDYESYPSIKVKMLERN